MLDVEVVTTEGTCLACQGNLSSCHSSHGKRESDLPQLSTASENWSFNSAFMTSWHCFNWNRGVDKRRVECDIVSLAFSTSSPFGVVRHCNHKDLEQPQLSHEVKTGVNANGGNVVIVN